MKLDARGAQKTWGEKVLVLLWLLIPAVGIGASFYGWSIGDAPGGILLGFLPVSFLTVVSVIVALVVKSSMSRFSRPVWLVVSLAALFAAMIFASRPDPDAIKGADTILAYVMLILSFPFALIVPFILMVIAPFLSGGGGNLIGLCGMWVFFVIAGYLQWFVLLPWLLSKWAARREQKYGDIHDK